MSVTLTLNPLKAHALAQALVWGDRTARKGGYSALADTMNALHDDLLLAQLDALPPAAAPASLWDHPRLSDWQYLVNNGDTLRGFREWLDEEADRDCGACGAIPGCHEAGCQDAGGAL